MDVRPLPPDEAAVRRFVEALWLPYHRELEATVARHALADGVDLVAEEVAYRLERLREPDHHEWVALEGGGDRLVDRDATLAGFVTAGVDPSPPVFDQPDRLVVGDLYVREPFRGTGLAGELIGVANDRALSAGCGELALDVDVDNERALAFYERVGFEPCRHELARPVERG